MGLVQTLSTLRGGGGGGGLLISCHNYVYIYIYIYSAACFTYSEDNSMVNGDYPNQNKDPATTIGWQFQNRCRTPTSCNNPPPSPLIPNKTGENLGFPDQKKPTNNSTISGRPQRPLPKWMTWAPPTCFHFTLKLWDSLGMQAEV